MQLQSSSIIINLKLLYSSLSSQSINKKIELKLTEHQNLKHHVVFLNLQLVGHAIELPVIMIKQHPPSLDLQ